MSVKSYEEENEEVNKLYIQQEKNDFYSEIVGNLCCMCALRFVNVFLKNMKKTLKIFHDSKVTLSLYADYGTFYQGYKGTPIKFNQIIIGKQINRIKEISVINLLKLNDQKFFLLNLKYRKKYARLKHYIPAYFSLKSYLAF